MMPKFESSLFITIALIVGACDTEDPDELDLMLAASGGPVSGSTGETDGEDSGGEDSGGEDEVSMEFEYSGDGPVCEPEELEHFNLVREAGVDDFADALNPALGAVACPWTAGVKSTYVDYSCTANNDGTADLRCDYACNCSVHYDSPCNPTHADCGADWGQKNVVTSYIGISPFGMWQCHLQGAIQCNLKNESDGLPYCLSSCEANIPKRTRDCPGCK
jgi:hypothetical protein